MTREEWDKLIEHLKNAKPKPYIYILDDRQDKELDKIVNEEFNKLVKDGHIVIIDELPPHVDEAKVLHQGNWIDYGAYVAELKHHDRLLGLRKDSNEIKDLASYPKIAPIPFDDNGIPGNAKHKNAKYNNVSKNRARNKKARKQRKSKR